MRKPWLYISALTLLIVFAGPDALAVKKSRGRKKTVSAKKEARSKSSRARATNNKRSTKHERGTRALSRRESRHLSRRERRELARGGRADEERYVVRGRNGRRYVRYRPRRRNDADVAAVTPTPRPASGISPERVTEIQQALIKAGFMEGEATGQYDEITIQAMKQFQSASRLPQTGTPTAAALKKLGVSKRSNDGYAVPVNSVSERDKKRVPQTP
jgi:hypothetical protein